jgi:hypothetical protein
MIIQATDLQDAQDLTLRFQLMLDVGPDRFSYRCLM